MSESDAGVSQPSHAGKSVYAGRVISNDNLCLEHWRLVLEVEGFPQARPGQFLQILCADPQRSDQPNGALLRRPFSIGGLQTDGTTSQVTIIHRVVGTGTHWLSRLHPGDPVSVLGPLGKPFTMPSDMKRAWVVGGGVGLPPIVWLAQVLAKQKVDVLAFCGARSQDALALSRIRDIPVVADEPSLAFEEFACAGVPALLTTDDGSLGSGGLIPELMQRYLDLHPEETDGLVVYTCGPERMMAAVAETCLEHEIPCQVCMERMMACGMGTCQSCVVEIRDEAAEQGWSYKLCCTDGPVFDARDIMWNARRPA